MAQTGLSLWLMPEQGQAGTLRELVEELALRLGTPVFPPHVTLLGRLAGAEAEALERCAALAAGLRPLTLTLERAAHAEEYYRCLVLEAAATPELLGAHQKARRSLGPGPDRFRPHLSLVYGRLPADRRETLAGEVRERLALPLRVRADRLQAHRTAGPPHGWSAAASFPLGGDPG